MKLSLCKRLYPCPSLALLEHLFNARYSSKRTVPTQSRDRTLLYHCVCIRKPRGSSGATASLRYPNVSASFIQPTTSCHRTSCSPLLLPPWSQFQRPGTRKVSSIALPWLPSDLFVRNSPSAGIDLYHRVVGYLADCSGQTLILTGTKIDISRLGTLASLQPLLWRMLQRLLVLLIDGQVASSLGRSYLANPSRSLKSSRASDI